METIAGQAFLLVAGNHDFLLVCSIFSIGVGVIFSVMKIWKFVEGRVSE